MYRLGDHWDHSTVRLDFSMSLQQWLNFFTPRIHAQYFTGYGQTFIQYNKHSNGYRIGISLFDRE
jgi:outer membrane phospholipase A